MNNVNNIIKLAEKVARKMIDVKNSGMKEECPIGIIDFNNWEWPQGVGLYGLYRMYEFTGNKEYLEYIMKWYDRHIEEGIPEKNVNTTAPLLALALLYEHTQDMKYYNICDEFAKWVMYEAPRTKDNGIQHVVSGFANEQQLWDDTLYMCVLFLAKFGMMINRQDYVEEAVHQFLVHIKYLFDKQTGLWFHGWTFKENCNFANARWARGNCWFTSGVVDFIEITGIEGGVKQYLLDTLLSQIEKLGELQTREGLWHTLLDDPSSYVEVSAAAGFGHGILKAVRKGYIDSKYRIIGEKAVHGIIPYIAEDGTVEQVSYGTGMGWDLDHYRNIPICPMTYGQALVILLLTEYMAL